MANKRKEQAQGPGERLICRNARALQRYEVDERIEVGIVLVGSEVKSLRERRGDLEGAYASVESMQLYLHGMHIAPYLQATVFAHEPKRRRKLLAHHHEIERLHGRLATKGYTLIPLRAYFKGGRVKLELGLAKGKRVGDQREQIRRKQDLREARDAMQRGGARGRRRAPERAGGSR